MFARPKSRRRSDSEFRNLIFKKFNQQTNMWWILNSLDIRKSDNRPSYAPWTRGGQKTGHIAEKFIIFCTRYIKIPCIKIPDQRPDIENFNINPKVSELPIHFEYRITDFFKIYSRYQVFLKILREQTLQYKITSIITTSNLAVQKFKCVQ